ncbi:hypothetical protein HanRHA438_Chr11g0497431 [Helianthus annuus]|nr:hypothetical protein HanRHA438_Chr11g0497431 [Helianthus annuus]
MNVGYLPPCTKTNTHFEVKQYYLCRGLKINKDNPNTFSQTDKTSKRVITQTNHGLYMCAHYGFCMSTCANVCAKHNKFLSFSPV